MYNGILNVYKEAGFTSHDVVAKLRGIYGQKKIGHTGTLDPAAEGVLPVALGSATRLCDLLVDKEKEYTAVLLLGIRTDTQDTTGQVLEAHPVEATEEQIREAVLGFQGAYDQVPPMYSALKVNGKKLYELARAGKEVERLPRPVEIYEIRILEMELPRVKFSVHCSKGTYVRTLCDDIGRKLGCGGAMEHLLRTRVGQFGLRDAVPLSEIQRRKDAGYLSGLLIPVDACFPGTAALHVCGEHQTLLRNGNPFLPEHTAEGLKYGGGERIRIYDEKGVFWGLYAYEPETGRYKPVKMFPPGD